MIPYSRNTCWLVFARRAETSYCFIKPCSSVLRFIICFQERRSRIPLLSPKPERRVFLECCSAREPMPFLTRLQDYSSHSSQYTSESSSGWSHQHCTASRHPRQAWKWPSSSSGLTVSVMSIGWKCSSVITCLLSINLSLRAETMLPLHRASRPTFLPSLPLRDCGLSDSVMECHCC